MNTKIFYNHILFNNQINGLFHIASQKISKYELSNLFAKYFNKDIKISRIMILKLIDL